MISGGRARRVTVAIPEGEDGAHGAHLASAAAALEPHSPSADGHSTAQHHLHAADPSEGRPSEHVAVLPNQVGPGREPAPSSGSINGLGYSGRAGPSLSVASQLMSAMEQRALTHRCQFLWNCWHHAFQPDDTFRVVWDLFMLALVVFSCFSVPYNTAFWLEEELRENPKRVGMSPTDMMADLLFYVDMLLNFWTGYSTGYATITDKWLIAKNYLSTRFTIDLLSTVEWDILIRLLICGADGCTGDLREVNDYSALTRMLKVLRLARAGPLLSRLSGNLTVHSAYLSAAIFFLYVLVVAHVLACLFYMIPILFECAEVNGTVNDIEVTDYNYTCMPTSWRTNHGANDPNNVRIQSSSEQYISALYWSEFCLLLENLSQNSPSLPFCHASDTTGATAGLTTMTTIGYGDRGPGNSPEIAFTLIAEVLGLSFFALLLFQITSVYEELNSEKDKEDKVKDEIIQFMKRHLVCSGNEDKARKSDLIARVVKYLHFKSSSQSSRITQFEADGAFGELSPPLRREIREAVFNPMLKTLRLFGHSALDERDAITVQGLFEKEDKDSSGQLDQTEVRTLIENLGVTLEDEQFDLAMAQMDAYFDSDGARCSRYRTPSSGRKRSTGGGRQPSKSGRRSWRPRISNCSTTW
eukprot:COSAG05_NODE_1794_length_4078_cov_2.720784_2_plen_641_part_00